MNHVITPAAIEIGSNATDPDARSTAAGRARRRAEHDFVGAHSGLGIRVVYRLACALSGERA